MYFIYSVKLNDYSVKLYDYCNLENSVNEMLDNVARNFIKQKDGEKRAEDPYRDGVEDSAINEDGHFLRHSTVAKQIDVYLRKTAVDVGTLWNSYTIKCDKIMQFSVTEASLGLPIEKSCRGSTEPKFSTALDAAHHVKHLSALKECLALRAARLDCEEAVEVAASDVDTVICNDCHEPITDNSDWSTDSNDTDTDTDSETDDIDLTDSDSETDDTDLTDSDSETDGIDLTDSDSETDGIDLTDSDNETIMYRPTFDLTESSSDDEPLLMDPRDAFRGRLLDSPIFKFESPLAPAPPVPPPKPAHLRRPVPPVPPVKPPRLRPITMKPLNADY